MSRRNKSTPVVDGPSVDTDRLGENGITLRRNMSEREGQEITERYTEALFASRGTLEWVQEQRAELLSGTRTVTMHDGEERQVAMLPAMLASNTDEMRDAGCTEVLRLLYNNNKQDLRNQLEAAGFSATESPRYVLLNTGETTTNGGTSMHEGIMIVDEDVSPARITVIYRGTKDAEDFRAHVQGAGDYAFGQRIETYVDDHARLSEETHPLITAELDRLRAAHPEQASDIGLTFFGHSLGADPAARDAAYFNDRYQDMEVDYVGIGAASSLTRAERREYSTQIRGREMEIYNEDDPLANVSSLLRPFNGMDSLGGTGSNRGEGTEDRINVRAGHTYYDSMLMRGFQANIERFVAVGTDGWQARLHDVVTKTEPNRQLEQRVAYMHELAHAQLDEVCEQYTVACNERAVQVRQTVTAALEASQQISSGGQAVSPSLLAALDQYRDPNWQPSAPANDDQEPAVPAIIAAMAREAASGIVH